MISGYRPLTNPFFAQYCKPFATSATVLHKNQPFT